MVKRFKTIKINLSISNKLLYSIIAVFLIVAIGAVVYAAGGTGGTPNPGHSASEISGVCKTDGTGCPSTLNNKVKDPITEITTDVNGKLCWKYTTGGGCSIQQTICSANQVTTPPFSGQGYCPNSADRLSTCISKCNELIACSGDTSGLSGCSGGAFSNSYYNKGVSTGCSESGNTWVYSCLCSMNPSIISRYNKEVAGGGTPTIKIGCTP